MIQLTRNDDKKVYVNPDHICFMEPATFTDVSMTEVWINGCYVMVRVRETVEQIQAMISMANNWPPQPVTYIPSVWPADPGPTYNPHDPHAPYRYDPPVPAYPWTITSTTEK